MWAEAGTIVQLTIVIVVNPSIAAADSLRVESDRPGGYEPGLAGLVAYIRNAPRYSLAVHAQEGPSTEVLAKAIDSLARFQGHYYCTRR